MAEPQQFASSLGEVATHFGIPLSVVRRWRDEGGCPHLKREPYDLKAIAAWAEQRTDASNPNAQEETRWWCLDNKFKALGIIAPIIFGIIIYFLTLSSKNTAKQDIDDTKVGKTRGPHDDLIGKTLPEARGMLGLKQMTVRVVIEDGKDLLVTMDHRTNRVDVEIRDGRIVRVVGLH
jgi:hypothetical protein